MIVSNRVVLVLFAASSARMIATWASAGYMAVYYHREYPSQISLYSVLNAGFVSVGGMASSYGGGVLSDRLRVRNEGVLGYIPALGSLAAIGPMAVVLFSKDFYVSVTALFVSYLVGECWLGPGMACLQMELPKELAGTSVAILLFLNSVICNVGTWFIGKMDSGLATVRKPFFAVLLMSYVASFFLFGVLGLMVSRKHQRRNSCLLSLRAAGILEDGAGSPGCGGGSSSGKEYGGGDADSRNGRQATSVCEMVMRRFSRTAGGGGASYNGSPSTDDFGEYGGLGEEGDGQEEVVGYSDVEFNVPSQRYAGGGGGHAPTTRRPVVARGRSATRGDSGMGGGRSRGAAAAAAAAGVGASVSSTKMR
ncbi:unnamed protein product [Ectocarpus fasciculatus]